MTTRRKSPVDQNAPKIKAIKSILDPLADRIAVEGVVVMSHRDCALPVDAPLEVMLESDLQYFFRLLYHRSLNRAAITPAQLNSVRHLIQAASDRAEDAKHRFLMQLAERGIGAFEYAGLQNMIEELQSAPAPKVKPLWRHVTTYVPLFLFLLFIYAKAEVFRDRGASNNSARLSTNAARTSKIAQVKGAPASRRSARTDVAR